MAVQTKQHVHVEEHSAEWQLDLPDCSILLDASYVTNHRTPEYLVATGFGEDAETSHVAQTLGEMGFRAAVRNVKYPEMVGGKKLTLTPDIVEQTILKSFPAIHHKLNRDAGRDQETPLYMAGRSRGFGELLKFASSNPDSCQELTGAAPLGVNCVPEIMGTSVQENRNFFKKRLRASGLVSVLIEHPEAARLLNEYKAGTEYIQTQNGPDMIKQLIGLGKLKRIIVGEGDPFCPPYECEQALGVPGVIVRTTGQHDPIRTPQGMAQLALAISMLG